MDFQQGTVKVTSVPLEMWQIIELPLPIVWGLSGGGGATTWREKKERKNLKSSQYKIKIGDTVANVNASEHFGVRFFYSPRNNYITSLGTAEAGKKGPRNRRLDTAVSDGFPLAQTILISDIRRLFDSGNTGRGLGPGCECLRGAAQNNVLSGDQGL